MDEEMKTEAKQDAQAGLTTENDTSQSWRLERDAAAMAREKLQEKAQDIKAEEGREQGTEGSDGALAQAEAGEQPETNDNVPSESEPAMLIEAATGTEREVEPAGMPADGEETAPALENERPLSRRERRQKEKEEAAAQKAAKKEEEACRKREAEEEKERKKREDREEKERQKRLAAEEKQRKQHEKKEAKNVVRQERRREWGSLIHTAEFAMLVTFIVLAVDQAGLYGFLFVWLFIALMVASVALLLLGIIRAARKKRCGIIFFVAVVGIIVCTGWFIYLISSQGLGLGPIPT